MYRRQFIKSLASTAAGRCLLGPVALSAVNHNAYAQAQTEPNFVSFVTPIGHHPDWFPTTTGSEYQMSDICSSLTPHRDKLAIIKDMWSVLKHFGNDGAHRAGYPAATTGHIDDAAGINNALGLSIDQHLIRGWGNNARSIQLGVLPVGDSRSFISWSGANAPLSPQGNARILFDTLFRALSGTVEEQARIRQRGESVLDVWTGDLNRLKNELGEQHRQAFDLHLTHIDELGQSLAQTNTCSTDIEITNNDAFYTTDDNYPVVGKQMMDLIVLALSCGQARAASLVWNRAGSAIKHKWVLGDATLDHHAITHAADVDNSFLQIEQIDRWYTEQFAYLLDQLEATPNSGGGNLLENTLVYWASETGRARSHTGAQHGVVIAGNPNNYFNMGSSYRFNQRPLNDLLAEIATGLGIYTPEFGNLDFSTGKLPAIRA